MTGYIFSAILVLYPALQSVTDLGLQLAFQLAVLAVFLAWLFLKASGPGLPGGLADRRFLPLWAAAALSLAAAAFSPFSGYIVGEWGNFGCGLLIFLCASFMPQEERERAGRALLWGAWLVVSLSVVQAFALHNFAARPPLTNLNALALYCVMVLPVALERRAWVLSGLLVGLTIWTQSLGAALAALTAAGFYAASRGRALKENAAVFAALALLGCAVLLLVQADSAAGRLAWWRGALSMIAERPLSGFGHSAYTWAQALFQPAGFREHSIYAHNYYLEFIAENGLFAAAAWFAALWAAARRRGGLARYAVIAALAHSLVDFGLSVPANFWLFCFLLASPAPEGPAFKPSPSALRAGLLAAALLTAALGRPFLGALAFERHRSAALAAAAAGDPAGAEAALSAELKGDLFRQPALEFLGRILMTTPGGELRAAACFEEALLLNRYSAASWRALERIYSAPGREAAAAGLARRKGAL